ncbi:uncharacterized protein TNIN_46231 [Trichonephila inaurata madagascariensis]|uniref:Uncharacterized protein n=1 Tax=Trichonephila inaurata madagascariensis TaxID=2747483 RepID=A0A8X6YQX9_9ARAC|nr:uncharacterized protein TNIN_46231 [Trichonephila inaurata madagascariensis]
MLADKLEAFNNIRRSLPSGSRRHVKASETVNDGRQMLWLWGQGVIKSRCPTCNPSSSQRTDVATNHINAYTFQTRSPQMTLIDITFCGIKGRVCADTGSQHSCAEERMYQVFKDKGLLFQETTLAMSLADGQQTTERECERLTSAQKEKLNLLLESFQNVFQPGGEATTMLDHHINTGNSPPISVPILLLRKRGRPPKVPQTPGSSSGRRRNQRGRM